MAAAQSPPELQHYQLLKSLREQGFTCPSGQRFPPNAGPFLFDCRAWKAARAHAEDMAARRYFGHVSPEGRNPCDRSRFCSENIAAGQATPQAALDAWKGSARHCTNMMDPKLNRFGVGYVGKPGTPYTHYWVQNMGTSDSFDGSCMGGPTAAPACEDLNAACASYRGYAGSQWCNETWPKGQCPKTCGTVRNGAASQVATQRRELPAEARQDHRLGAGHGGGRRFHGAPGASGHPGKAG